MWGSRWRVLADKEMCVWSRRKGSGKRDGVCLCVCVWKRERERGKASKVACCIRHRLQHPRARGGLSHVNTEPNKQTKQVMAPLPLLTCWSEIRVNESDKKKCQTLNSLHFGFIRRFKSMWVKVDQTSRTEVYEIQPSSRGIFPMTFIREISRVFIQHYANAALCTPAI